MMTEDSTPAEQLRNISSAIQLSSPTGLFALQESDFATSLRAEAELSSFPPSTLPVDMNQDQILVNKSSLLPVTNLTALPDWNLQTARQGPVLMATGDMLFTFEAVSSSTNPADILSETMPSFIHCVFGQFVIMLSIRSRYSLRPMRT